MTPDLLSSRKTRTLLHKLLLGLTAAVLLMSTACNLPVRKTTATPTLPPSAVAPTPAAVAKPLPAAVVETLPLPNSDLAADNAVTVYFNQPMERASVEGALRTEPALAGRFEWPDDATMRFVPDQPLPPGTPLTVSFEKTAAAENGLGMADPVSFQFQTAPYLSVTERLPRPESTEVDPASAVVAAFNLPVVPLGQTGSGPQAFTIAPAVEGRGEWLNTSTYIFYPEPALRGGITYTVSINPDLTGQSGSPLTADASPSWAFTTALPRIVNLEPASGSQIGLDDSITLTFNQVVDPASVERAFAFGAPGGANLAGEFAWGDDGTKVTFQPAKLLTRNATYNLTVSTEAVGLGGTPISEALQATFYSVPNFDLVSTTPAQSENLRLYSGYGNLSIEFTAPLEKNQDFNELVQFDPPIGEEYYYPSDQELSINGFFNPGTTYTMTLSGEITDRWNMPLGRDFTLRFNTNDSQPALTIPMVQASGSRVIFLTPDDRVLPGNATNLFSLDIRSGRMDELNFIAATLSDIQPTTDTRWQQTLNLEPNRNQTIGIELSPGGQPLAPGLYAFQIRSPQLSGQYTDKIEFYVVSSRIQMTLKESRDEMLVWAVDLETNQPVDGLEVRLLNQEQTEVGSGTTDADGLVTIPLSPERTLYEYLYAVSGQPGDANFSMSISNWSAGINSWEYGIPTAMEMTIPSVYLYTDRPIYRPGQTVYLRGIVRVPDNGRYELPPSDKYTVALISPYNELTGETATIEEQSKALTAFGTFSMAFTLPETAAPGGYHFELPEANAYLYFEVANYRKPEMEVKVQFEGADAITGADLQAQIQASYYFGAPAGNLPVTWQLVRDSSYFYLPGGYQVGPMDTSWLNPYGYGMMFDTQYLTSGETRTDASGNVNLTITPDDLAALDPADLHKLTLEVTITDPTNQPVSGRGSVRLLPAEFAIGVRPEAWSSQAGDELGFSILSADWNQQTWPNARLQAKFEKVTWRQRFSADGGQVATQPEYTLVGSTDFATGSDGQARIAFTPQEPGIYQVSVSGGKSLTEIWVWVGGAGSAPWPSLANQRLRLTTDAQSYAPGETAQVFIPNPYPAGATALITVERARVMQSEVIEISGTGLNYQLPLKAAFAPNVFLSVTLLGRDGDRFDFRQGFIEIPVDPAEQILEISLTGEPVRAQPAGNLTVTLEVRDSAGRPVQGEFSLALVDKAVLALADPNSASITDAYYGEQYLGVFTSLSLAAYGRRDINLPPGRGGGGGGDVAIGTTVREEFRDTAFWNGALVTDEAGRAQVSLTLPDNVTTWVGMVRGITLDSMVGEAELEIIATRDLLVRPVTPRFLVAGDHLELAAVVHNNTDQAMMVDVSLQAAGFGFDEPARAVQSVQVAAGGQQRVVWWGNVESVDEVDLVFGARGGGLEDYARPTWGKLPVLKYLSPQTFGTAGVLYEAGARQETVSLPRTFAPEGGELKIELSPSLAAAILSDLTVLEQSHYDFTETIVSRILPNLETYRAIRELGIGNAALENQLSDQIKADLPKLYARQKSDGGWGWDVNAETNPQISTYALWALIRAKSAGFEVASRTYDAGLQYLWASLITPQMASEDYQLDRLAFQYFVLAEAGETGLEPQALLGLRSRLNPWAKAMLALALEEVDPGNNDTQTLLSDLQATALRSATGVNWQDAVEYRQNFVTRNLSTAIVTYALARLDPASPLLVDAARYLITNRKEIGGWSTSYESAWVLTALIETMQGTGDLQASYEFAAALNGTPLASGEAGGATSLNPVRASVPISQLLPQNPNELLITRQAGPGRLYYRAYLTVNRPAQDATPLSRGMTLERRYYQPDGSCALPDCKEINSARLDSNQSVWVRLTLTVPSDQYYAVVEDWLPAGTEVLDLSLKTSQLYQSEGTLEPLYSARSPFSQGWGWWYFGDPRITDQSVTWVAPYLPAGTYELAYQLVPTTAGEFQVLPAHAFIYYFPEVEATSAGNQLTIQP